MSVIPTFCGQATHPYPTSMVALKSLPLLLYLLQVETPSAGQSFVLVSLATNRAVQSCLL